MPKKVELIKIFLASPGDVKTERNYFKKVIDEINRTVAQDKNVRLDFICSDNSHPGYGKDGQKIINEQIGQMPDYTLFIGIMKNRYGTPTKRAGSGTIEEYQRAKKAHKETGKPDIWFYFGSMAKGVKKKAELEQQRKVKAFKTRYSNSKNALFKEYTSPSDFRNKLREQITLWLNNRSKKRTRRSSTTLITKKKSENKTKVANNLNQTISISSKSIKERKSTTNKNKTATKSKINHWRSSTGAWVLLGDNVFETQSVKQDKNYTIILKIPVRSTDQEVDLLNLQSNSPYSSSYSYSYKNNAYEVEITSIESESIKGNTSYIIALRPRQQSNNFYVTSYNNYSIKEVTELKIRSLLLNKIPKNQNKDNNSIMSHMLIGSSYPNNSKTFIFNDIRKRWKNNPEMFLIHARLAAVHELKSKNIVEHILNFKLSLNENILSINLRGRIKQQQNIYTNQETITVEVKDKCTLKP